MNKFFVVFMLSWALVMVQAQTPVFENGVLINDNTNPINVGSYSAPHVYDWDGDGAKDLLVGQLDLGKIRFYRNTGTNGNPLFNGFAYLRADATDISLPVG